MDFAVESGSFPTEIIFPNGDCVTRRDFDC